MEWNKEIEDLYTQITDLTPEGFRASVKPILCEVTEKTAYLQNLDFKISFLKQILKIRYVSEPNIS